LEDDSTTKRTTAAIGTLKRIKYDNSFSNDVKKFLFVFFAIKIKLYIFSHQQNDQKIV
jgi:hypothetical protein